MAVAPNITYTITYTKPGYDTEGGWGKTETIPLSGTVRMSTANDFSTINVIYNSDISLSRYEARITAADDEYGVGIGKLVYDLAGSIAASTNHAYTIRVNTTNFYLGDITYRISMYAQNAADLTWDATSFLLTTTGANIVDKDNNLLEVYVVGDTNAIVERTDEDELTATNLTSVTLTNTLLEVN